MLVLMMKSFLPSLSGAVCLAFALAASASSDIPRTLEDLKARLIPLDPTIDPNTSDYYLGYRGKDFKTPWAKYFNDTPVTLSKEFQDGLNRSPVPASEATPFKNAPKELNKAGYLKLENGFSFLDDGTLELAIRTDVPPNFTGEMYDFWFSWHINDTTKYKLWNPRQHQYAGIEHAQLKENVQKTSYRERYWDVTSYVDEYIASEAFQLSIGFFDPRILGFSPENPATGVQTLVTAFVRPFVYTHEYPLVMAKIGFTPDDIVLAHQVRRKPSGSGMEIRSRFWLGQAVLAGLRLTGEQDTITKGLTVHCYNEMNHLGTFLPALFAEFKNDVAV